MDSTLDVSEPQTEGARPQEMEACAMTLPRTIDWETGAKGTKNGFGATTSTLFGRESQERLLLEAYRRRTTPNDSDENQMEIVLITGASGTGKTVLAKSLQRRVKAERGHFCYGKCDQMQHNEPFAPFRSAVNQLVCTLLQEDDSGEETARLEEAIEEATKDTDTAMTLTLLTSLFPIFQKVFKEMDISKEEVVRESRSSHVHSTTDTPAMIIFGNFLRAFCCMEHPVVMLLDDWQWLDSSSLELLKTLGTLDDIPGLMILGTCRGNEVSVVDPLSVVLRTLEEQEVRITDIQLTSLSAEVVQDMITNLLQLPSSDGVMMRALAEMIHQLTGGNPFFVQQNLRALYEAKLIYYTNGSWNWDEQAMSAHDHFEVTRNRILDTAVRKLADESQAMQETLIIAAFLGASFSLKHLQVITVSDPPSIQNALAALVQQGVLQDIDSEGEFSSYRWTHDRFQSSAYSLVPANQQQAYSVEMGRLLLASLQPEEVEEHPFLLANLFLRDLSLLVRDEEKIQIAHLLHLAGTKAASSSAFESAASFFSHGIHLLQNGDEQHYAWDNEYELCLSLHNWCLEMECCNGHYERSDKLFEIVLNKARDLEDQMRAYEAKLHSLSARHMDAEGVVLAFGVLKQLGEPFPKKAVLLHTAAALGKTVLWLRRTSTDSMLKTRPMRRWDKIAAIRILQIMVPAVVRANPEYSALCACRSLQLTIRYGLPHHMSAPIFLGLGMILSISVVGLPNDAKRCAEVAKQLDHLDQASEWKCRLVGFEYGYINWWHQPFVSCVPNLIVGMNAGLLSGDVHVAYILSCFYSMYGFCTGIPLRQHMEEIQRQYNHFSRLDQKMLFDGISLELARRLCSDDAEAIQASQFSAYCDNETDRDELKWGRKDNALLTISVSCQLYLAVYTSDWAEGLRIWKRVKRLPYDEIYAVVMVVQLHFLFGMVEVMAAFATSKNKYWAGFRALRKLRNMNRTMSCTDNVLNKIYLLQAERAALRGDKNKARAKFLSSIRCAKKSSFIHEEALACERFALSLSRWDDTSEAQAYTEEAAILYHRWGFSRKAAQSSKGCFPCHERDFNIKT